MSYFSKKFTNRKIFASCDLTKEGNNWLYHRFIYLLPKINPVLATMKISLINSTSITCDLPIYINDCNEINQDTNEYEMKRKYTTLYKINSCNSLANEICKINYCIESISISNKNDIDLYKVRSIL